MDRQARKLTSGGKEGENGSENGSELGSNTDSESEEKVRFISKIFNKCMHLMFIKKNKYSPLNLKEYLTIINYDIIFIFIV